MSFDLDIGDEATAERIAREYVNNLSLQEVADGGRVEGDMRTLASPRAIASALAVAMLVGGADKVAGSHVSNVQVGNQPR